MVKLSGGIDPHKRTDMKVLRFGSLITQLIQLVDRVELRSEFNKAFHSLQVAVIRNLTHILTSFFIKREQTIQLVRHNAPTLQYLNISFYFCTDLSGIIQDDNGRYVEYSHLYTLPAKLDTNGAMPRRYAFTDAVPFPNLRRLISRGDYPFGEDLVLFRGNVATFELLKLDLTLKLTAALLCSNIFTPTSHPKLQCIMLTPPLGMSSPNNTDNPEIVQLMLDMAPDAAIRKISSWCLDPAPPPVLSLLSRHACLRVLALPGLRLSLWDAMTLIQSLPLLSDLHALAPTIPQWVRGSGAGILGAMI